MFRISQANAVMRIRWAGKYGTHSVANFTENTKIK